MNPCKITCLVLALLASVTNAEPVQEPTPAAAEPQLESQGYVLTGCVPQFYAEPGDPFDRQYTAREQKHLEEKRSILKQWGINAKEFNFMFMEQLNALLLTDTADNLARYQIILRDRFTPAMLLSHLEVVEKQLSDQELFDHGELPRVVPIDDLCLRAFAGEADKLKDQSKVVASDEQGTRNVAAKMIVVQRCSQNAKELYLEYLRRLKALLQNWQRETSAAGKPDAALPAEPPKVEAPAKSPVRADVPNGVRDEAGIETRSYVLAGYLPKFVETGAGPDDPFLDPPAEPKPKTKPELVRITDPMRSFLEEKAGRDRAQTIEFDEASSTLRLAGTPDNLAICDIVLEIWFFPDVLLRSINGTIELLDEPGMLEHGKLVHIGTLNGCSLRAFDQEIDKLKESLGIFPDDHPERKIIGARLLVAKKYRQAVKDLYLQNLRQQKTLIQNWQREIADAK